MPESTISDNDKALAIMAHDLKAPLSAIVSLLSVIKKGYVNDMQKACELAERAWMKIRELIAIAWRKGARS